MKKSCKLLIALTGLVVAGVGVYLAKRRSDKKDYGLANLDDELFDDWDDFDEDDTVSAVDELEDMVHNEFEEKMNNLKSNIINSKDTSDTYNDDEEIMYDADEDDDDI